jgi:hypothetical protein
MRESHKNCCQAVNESTNMRKATSKNKDAAPQQKALKLIWNPVRANIFSYLGNYFTINSSCTISKVFFIYQRLKKYLRLKH